MARTAVLVATAALLLLQPAEGFHVYVSIAQAQVIFATFTHHFSGTNLGAR